MSGDPKQWRIGIVGYGEVGKILAEDLRAQGIKVAAYDVKLADDRDVPTRDTDFLFRLAQGGRHAIGVAWIAAPAGKANLSAVVGQMIRAPRQQHRQAVHAAVDQGHKHGGRL